jgi:GMP synthase (glutamine-hydrolysing)
MKYLIVNHHPNREVGIIETLKKIDDESEFVVCNAYENSAMPHVAGFDAGFLSGGKPCVSQIDKYSWMRSEIKWLGGAAICSFPLLGICLGHHLMAASCGGEVEKDSRSEEMGWTAINLLERHADELLNGMPKKFTSFQFHNDSIAETPAQTLTLASTSACKNQILKYLDRPWYSTQFHPEIDKETGEAVYNELGVDTGSIELDEVESPRLLLFRNFLAFATTYNEEKGWSHNDKK